jgi:hypothetical protein
MHAKFKHVVTPTRRAAEPVILSRKCIDNDVPKSAGQSANFQLTRWVLRISAARTAEAFVAHLLHGSQLDRSTLRQEFEQLHQAWPGSGLARFGPTTQKPIDPGLLRSIRPTRASGTKELTCGGR